MLLAEPPLQKAIRHEADPGLTLIDELLADQRRLTAVERFSQRHDRSDLPHMQSHYRSLIPLSKPRPGEQYAFEVDLDACSGCKACVTACHSLNGLDDDVSWRDVGSLISPRTAEALQLTVTTACHHCVEPGCLEGCPVKAYEKDPDTGIVRHLDDQCIGCQYCVMKCPYDVPKYSAKRGIVRKCDMCHNRLAADEAPACVQSCPNGAITIRVRSKTEARHTARRGEFLPDSPAPDQTVPTTVYKSAKSVGPLVAANHFAAAPQHGHSPLVVMLILTQAAAGASLIAFIWGLFDPATKAPAILQALGLGFLAIGLFASVLHLGQPLKAWRSFLGWRTSWLSREIIAFGVYFKLSAVALALTWFAPAGFASGSAPLMAVQGAAAAAGLLGVVCSVMVYVDTGRRFWGGIETASRFCGSVVILGLAAAGLTASILPAEQKTARCFAALLAVCTVAKLLKESFILTQHPDGPDHELWKTASLMTGVLRSLSFSRFCVGMVGGTLFPLGLLVVGRSLPLAIATLIASITAEALERRVFFRAVAPARMPGSL